MFFVVGVGAKGTIKAALSGSNAKQGVRYYKLLFEAILRTKLAFTEESQAIETGVGGSSNDFEMHGPDSLEITNSKVHTESNVKKVSLEAAITCLQVHQTADSLNKVVNHPDMVPLSPLPGAMAMRMDSLIDMFDLLLNMIHFQRTGNWEGFLQAIDEFLPWCFALNRQNYARNMSYYYVDMLNLKTKNPMAYKYLMDGGFSGSLSGANHSKLPMDQLIEMTINRLSKDTLSNEEFFKRITIDPVDNSATFPVHQQFLSPQTEPVRSTSHSISASSSPSVYPPSETTPQNSILKYNAPIKKQKVITFDKLVQKKNKFSILEDEGNAFAAILTGYDKKKLDLNALMQWPIITKPWAI